jgi:hypothetical protein
MADQYCYKLDECDVPEARRPIPESYRAKRRDWIRWPDDDEDHAIWTTISQMVWSDVAFRSLAELAISNPASCLTCSARR